VPPEAAFALVLGANLGTAVNPVLEGTRGNDPLAKRLPMGDLVNRVIESSWVSPCSNLAPSRKSFMSSWRPVS
jgi:Na+/phosphate symporter